MNRWVPAAVGLAGIAASVVGADVWAARTDRPTISAAVAATLEHPVLAPITIGILSGLGWHLVADPILSGLGWHLVADPILSGLGWHLVADPITCRIGQEAQP